MQRGLCLIPKITQRFASETKSGPWCTVICSVYRDYKSDDDLFCNKALNASFFA